MSEPRRHAPSPTPGTVPHARLDAQQRARLLGCTGCTVWLTGLPAAGKSTIASLVELNLLERKRPAVILDGDSLRHGLNAGLGFDAHARAEAVRRAGEAALLLAESGAIAIVSMVSPYRSDRDAVRARHEAMGLRFLEVFVDVPLSVAEKRDPKGLYRKARAGEIAAFTGVTDPYEAPHHPELRLPTDQCDAHACAGAVIAAISG